MPTYEYECGNCGKQFEFFQSMSEAPKVTCEECGGKLTKLLSAGSGLIFKGSGFYITDYKTKTGDSGAAKSEGGESAKGKKSEGGAPTAGETKKSDAKPTAAPSSGASESTSSSTKTE